MNGARAMPMLVRQVMIGAAAFTLLALLGPFIRAVVPLTLMGDFGDFIYFLVLSLWPALPLAIMEASIGTPAAIALALTVNVCLFALVGLLAGLVSRNLLVLRLLEIAVLFAVGLMALWWAGMNVGAVHLRALLLALVCYAVPFEWLAKRAPRDGAA